MADGLNQVQIIGDIQLRMADGGKPGTDTRGQTARNGRWGVKPGTDTKGQTTRNGRYE